MKMPPPRSEPDDLIPQGREGPHRRAALDEQTCRLICPIAAAMVGVCLTGIGLLRFTTLVHGRGTAADDILAVDALLFLIATLASYFALRVASRSRLHWLERVADVTFIVAMLLQTIACFVITYALNF
ncbi:hypothetical protein [Sphingobium sp. CR28]|uniref:hypothetical protein n=1 Tax=Sphingobium sp. CR28 TaxID=3400272 RepID=UPI003FF029E8